ncbi:pyridoxal 5'-phosphate synthase glutaminase subunit PdxT [Candidatus Peribacteria bacterium]|nr:MAG: pyridoxal 5'-phosphate synthase glutaminase subunit PdxT [Candidatus Peribacteria bacterium]
MSQEIPVIGILAFQGDVAEHAAIFLKLGHTATEIRTRTDLTSITHLVIPGGESTVIARFLRETGVGEVITHKVSDGTLAVFGTCAGAILLATAATGKNAPTPLGLIDITIERNAYGTQRDSFEADIAVTGIPDAVHAAFIRAPRITQVGQDVTVLASYQKEPVLVQSKRVLAGTFHPEVRGDTALHHFFLSL